METGGSRRYVQLEDAGTHEVHRNAGHVWRAWPVCLGMLSAGVLVVLFDVVPGSFSLLSVLPLSRAGVGWGGGGLITHAEIAGKGPEVYDLAGIVRGSAGKGFEGT